MHRLRFFDIEFFVLIGVRNQPVALCRVAPSAGRIFIKAGSFTLLVNAPAGAHRAASVRLYFRRMPLLVLSY